MMGVKYLKREKNLFKHSEGYWERSLEKGSSRKEAVLTEAVEWCEEGIAQLIPLNWEV